MKDFEEKKIRFNGTKVSVLIPRTISTEEFVKEMKPIAKKLKV